MVAGFVWLMGLCRLRESGRKLAVEFLLNFQNQAEYYPPKLTAIDDYDDGD